LENRRAHKEARQHLEVVADSVSHPVVPHLAKHLRKEDKVELPHLVVEEGLESQVVARPLAKHLRKEGHLRSAARLVAQRLAMRQRKREASVAEEVGSVNQVVAQRLGKHQPRAHKEARQRLVVHPAGQHLVKHQPREASEAVAATAEEDLVNQAAALRLENRRAHKEERQRSVVHPAGQRSANHLPKARREEHPRLVARLVPPHLARHRPREAAAVEALAKDLRVVALVRKQVVLLVERSVRALQMVRLHLERVQGLVLVHLGRTQMISVASSNRWTTNRLRLELESSVVESTKLSS